MSKKKVRKAKRQSSSPKESDRAAEIVATSQEGRRERRRVTAKQTGIPKKINSVDQLRDEYAYVLKDLRLIFAIAAVMFLILFGLNIFLS